MNSLKTCLSFFAAALLVFASPSVMADPVSAASSNQEQQALDFVRATAEKGLTFLSKPNSTEAEKAAEFKTLLNNSFDMDSIAKFSLGRYWNTANPAQQKEYLGLFKRMIVNVYTQRFGDYKGQKFEVKSARPFGNSDVLVMSQILPTDGSDSIQVDWRVRNKGGTYKIVDVYVENVSMSVTQRSDFSSVIQRGGGTVDVLISHLKQKI
jgi:phospholipid transport system substrate-binding protein